MKKTALFFLLIVMFVAASTEEFRTYTGPKAEQVDELPDGLEFVA